MIFEIILSDPQPEVRNHYTNITIRIINFVLKFIQKTLYELFRLCQALLLAGTNLHQNYKTRL